MLHHYVLKRSRYESDHNIKMLSSLPILELMLWIFHCTFFNQIRRLWWDRISYFDVVDVL
jgi:hypothetical protein